MQLVVMHVWLTALQLLTNLKSSVLQLSLHGCVHFVTV